MANWFVRKTGSDANAGTSAAAAWLTVNHALSHAGNAATVAGGDTIWVGAGTYREVLALTFSPTSALTVQADSDGSQTGDAGEVIVTAYTTNDQTAAVGTATLTIAGHPFHTFVGLTMIGSPSVNPGLINGNTSGWHDITFQQCTLVCMSNSGNAASNFADTSAATLNLTFDTCLFVYAGQFEVIGFNLPLNATADKDPVIVFRNCMFLQASEATFSVGGLYISQSGGSGSFKPGGAQIYNCTFFGGDYAVITAATMSTTIPTLVYNSVVIAGNTALAAGTSGQITEDFNYLQAPTLRSNVSAGTNSKTTTYALLMEWGQSLLRGATARPFMMPAASSPMLGFGGHAGGPSIDFLGYARPSGGASASNAIGYLERANSWGKEVSTVNSGSNAISITGPGAQDFELPVDAGSSTTVSVYLRYDATYAGTLPQLLIRNGGECGVADASVTCTAAANTWQQVSLIFTPSSSGIVTARVQSNDTNGGGHAYADTFSVA